MIWTIIVLCLICIYFKNYKNPCLYILLFFSWIPIFFIDHNVSFYTNPIFLIWVGFPIAYLIFELLIKDRL
jgi:hypothetical protein